MRRSWRKKPLKGGLEREEAGKSPQDSLSSVWGTSTGSTELLTTEIWTGTVAVALWRNKTC